jgi:hypothetical protein
MSEEKKQNNLISLKFSVTGKKVTIDKVNINQPLSVSVQKALDETGSARPIDDYDVLLNDNSKLDITHKVESFNFQDTDVIFISLRTGQGGNS